MWWGFGAPTGRRGNGGELCGVGEGEGVVEGVEPPGRRWLKSMETRDSRRWERLVEERPGFREWREADRPSPADRKKKTREKGRGGGGGGESRGGEP